MDEVMGEVIAVDIGGTKVAVARISVDGRLSAPEVAATPAADGDALWGLVAGLVDRVRADASRQGIRLVGVGVGCGGPMTPGGEEVSPLNIPGWGGFPLRRMLAAHTGLDVFVDTDAKALALAEGWLGAAAGVANFMAMVVSTGVGGGIVLDGR